MPQGGSFEHASAENLTILARAALAGSREDVNGFFAACTQYAFAAAIRLGRKHHGAEDSAQEAAMAVLELLERNALKPETIGGLIRTLVLRDAYAAAQRRLREADATAQMATPREVPDPAQEMETVEWARAVRDVVDALSPLLRRLIDLRHGEGLSTREIARELHVSHMTVTRFLRQAERMLGHRLQGLDGPGDERGRATPTDESRP